MESNNKYNISKDAFQVPAGYFDSIADKVLDKARVQGVINQPANHTSAVGKTINLAQWGAVITTVAASFLLLFMLSPNDTTAFSLDTIPTEDMVLYLDEYIDEIDTEYLYAEITSSTFEE